MKQIGLFNNENVAIPPAVVTEFKDEYLFFTARENSTIGFSKGDRDLQYSFDKQNWTNYNNTSVKVPFSKGLKIYWRRNNTTPIPYEQLGTFNGTGTWNVSGHLLSILDGYNYKTMTTLSGWGKTTNGIFENMFNQDSKIVDARLLYIGDLDVSWQGNTFRNFFISNETLVYGPPLTLNPVDSGTYLYAFANCYNLISIPEIKANKIWFYSTFINCSSLRYIKCLASEVVGSILGLPNGGILVKKRGVNWSNVGIPQDWTIIEED